MLSPISKKYTIGGLLLFSLPSMCMMIILSLYTIIDGMFVSNILGSNALSAVNIVFPIMGISLAISIMVATGGSAVISKYLGEGKKERAREVFSMLVAYTTLFSVLFTIIVCLNLEQLSYMLGADETLIKDCMTYLFGLALFNPACTLQTMYQSLFVVAGKPQFGFILSIISGVANVFFDYVCMHIWGMGVFGAALATGIGQCIPAVVGTVFFLKKNKELYFQKFHFYKKDFLKTCANGSSEMVTNVSTSIITVLFNLILIKMSGPDGVAAITIILYGQFVLSALFMGYSMGIAPILGFRLGMNDHEEIERLFQMSQRFILAISVAITLAAFFGSEWFITAFVKRGSPAWHLGVDGFRVFSIGYLFCGMNIFGSGFFTAISDGKSSAIISFLRTFVFILCCLAVFPKIMGMNGVWSAIPIAEFLTIFVTMGLVQKSKKKRIKK